MPETSAIVFDLDDTLYPEREYVFSGYASVATAFAGTLGGRENLIARMRELFDTPDRGRVFDVIVGEFDVADPDDVVTRMVATYRSHTPNIALFPDADAALDRLRPDHKLGLISDGYAVAQHAKIDALRLGDRLDAVIVTDDWGREFWKPHPRAFEEMSRRLDVAPSLCTYVADNPTKDFDAPNALGWRTLLIQRPDAVYADAPPAPAGTPHAKIASLDAL